MRRFIMSALLVAVVPLSATPAGAQFVPGRAPPPQTRLPSPIVVDNAHPGIDVWRDVDNIRDDIDHARESGILAKREARQLKRESRMIDTLAERYGQDGFSASEQRELETRSLYLQGLVNARRSR